MCEIKPSRLVTSNQTGIHQHLQVAVNKHLATDWQKPISNFSDDVFTRIKDWLALDDRPFILDSGCGTGESSARLAKIFPDCKVLGFDRSATRLSRLTRKTIVPDNCFTIRAKADDLWRQLARANLKPVRHFLLYPNPYRKPSQLNQRWHGSPVFPYLVALGGQLEVRTNWSIYAKEFAQALNLAAGITSSIATYTPDEPISPFEKKYHESGHTLWRLTADLRCE